MHMLGVILCGGQSLRMGTDKGLLKMMKSTWAQNAYEKLSQLDLSIVISVNSNQIAEYAELFNDGEIIIDNSKLQLKGPLCGVLSVHLQYPQQDLFVLACDMPLIETALLKYLFQLSNEDDQADAYLFLNEGEPEPLCAIYRSKALADIYQLYVTDSLSKHSMKFVLEQMHASFHPIKENQKQYFRNLNAHADINGL